MRSWRSGSLLAKGNLTIACLADEMSARGASVNTLFTQCRQCALAIGSGSARTPTTIGHALANVSVEVATDNCYQPRSLT
jgi:hypothetical protein